MDTKSLAIILVVFCAFLAAAGQVFLKLGSTGISTTITSWLNWKLILGIGIYAVSTILFVIALKYGSLSVLYPIIATSYIWVALLSIKILNEQVTNTQWIGFALLLTGVFLITKS